MHDADPRPALGSGTAIGERPATAMAHAAFTALMAAHEPTIARYLRHLVGDAEVARDLTQETFLSAYRAWATAVPANPGGWLYRVATNHAFAHFRRRRLIAWLPLGAWPGGGRAGHDPPPDERVAGDEAVVAALAALPPRQRACLLLSLNGFTGPEIADQLGLSPPAARMCLSRAREAFRGHYYGHAPGEV